MALGFFILLLFGVVTASPDAQSSTGTRLDAGDFRRSGRQSSTLHLYMMQLYRTARTGDRVGDEVPGVGVTGDNRDGRNFDSVVSTMAKRYHQTGMRWSFTFDMTSLSSHDTVQLAELHIHLPAFSESSSSSVDVYHSGRCSEAYCPPSGRLIGRFKAHPRSTGSSWKVFNVTKMLRRWLQTRQSTKTPEDAPEVMERVRHAPTDKVMMLTFLRQNPVGQEVPGLIHTAERSKYVGGRGEASGTKSRRDTGRQATEQVRRRPVATVETEDPVCQKEDMWVDFGKLGWNLWIIYPKRFNAYRCGGNCPTPVGEKFSPTNHAYVQSVLKMYHPERVPSPCCAPTRLSPLSILFYEKGKIRMKNHDDMVVEECGCH